MLFWICSYFYVSAPFSLIISGNILWHTLTQLRVWYFSAKIVTTSIEDIWILAEVLWGFISGDCWKLKVTLLQSHLERRSILRAANKNAPIKAHKVSSFMGSNSTYRNLPIVFSFGMYLRRSCTKVALVPSGAKIFKVRSLIGDFLFSLILPFIKISFCLFALLFFIDQNTWK